MRIEPEKFAMSPHIGAVVSNVDRDIAHDADSVTLAVGPELLPLPGKFELCELVNIYVSRQFLSPFF